MADELPDAPWASGGNDLPDAPWVAAQSSAPQATSHLGDVPYHIYEAGKSAIQGIKENLNPFNPEREKESTAQNILRTGKGLGAVGQLAAAPITGLAKTVAEPASELLASGVQTVGEPIAKSLNPEAKLPSHEEVAGAMEPDIETGLGLVMPAGYRTPQVPMPALPKPGPFGVTRSLGQETGDLNLIKAEQSARRDTSGPEALEQATKFDAQQKAQMELAKERISRGFDQFGGQEIAQSPQEAGSVVSQGMQDAADTAKQSVRDAYDAAKLHPGEIHSGVFEGMAQGIKGDLTLGDSPVIIDDKTTPFASKMIDDLDNRVSKLKIQNKADPFGAPNPENITGVNLTGVEQMRKRLSTFRNDAYASGNAADGRAASRVLGAFDERIDQAVNDGHFNGDPSAVQAWKDARAAHADYRSTFTAGKNDPVGRVVQQVLGRTNAGPLPKGPAIANDVADHIYGAVGTNPNSLNVAVADRFKTILGESSPEWTAVKQGLFRRLVGPSETEGMAASSPKKIADRINKFLNVDGVEMGRTVFAPHERDVLQRFADFNRSLEVPQSSANWSNNYPLLAAVTKVSRHVATAIGAGVGHMIFPGGGGEILGGVAGHQVVSAAESIQQIRAAAQIRKQMPLVAQQMQQWQKAVAAANRQNTRASQLAATVASAQLINTLRALTTSTKQVEVLIKRVAATLQSPGTVGAQPNQQNVPGEPPQKQDGGAVEAEQGFAQGGSVKKHTKAEADYRGGNSQRQCSKCQKFLPPRSCVGVSGIISPYGLCDYFQAQERENGK